MGTVQTGFLEEAKKVYRLNHEPNDEIRRLMKIIYTTTLTGT